MPWTPMLGMTALAIFALLATPAHADHGNPAPPVDAAGHFNFSGFKSLDCLSLNPLADAKLEILPLSPLFSTAGNSQYVTVVSQTVPIAFRNTYLGPAPTWSGHGFNWDGTSSNGTHFHVLTWGGRSDGNFEAGYADPERDIEAGPVHIDAVDCTMRF